MSSHWYCVSGLTYGEPVVGVGPTSAADLVPLPLVLLLLIVLLVPTPGRTWLPVRLISKYNHIKCTAGGKLTTSF